MATAVMHPYYLVCRYDVDFLARGGCGYYVAVLTQFCGGSVSDLPLQFVGAPLFRGYAGLEAWRTWTPCPQSSE